MNICFFNDEKATKFHPLTLTRPMDDLRIGIFTIREKWLHALQTKKWSRILPDFLENVFESEAVDSSSDCCWINSRFLPSRGLIEEIKDMSAGESLSFKGTTIAALVDGKLSQEMYENRRFSAEALTVKPLTEVVHLEHIWDLLSLNSYEIEKDLGYSNLKSAAELQGEFYEGIHNPGNTFIGEQVTIEPGCTLIAKEGPVVLQDGATVEAGSILRGPVVVGEHATVKMAARIYGGTTVGPVCKVGGEVSNCIFHSYSNKKHEGFTGNSIFGQWVNLGADTNTSNLKNNYSTARLADWNSKEEIETEVQFLGTVMADHSKTAINTMLNTGTVCGVSSNIFMSGFPPKYIPSFSWVGSEKYGEYDFDKAIEAMRAMMKRRDAELTEAYKAMMYYHFTNR